MTKSAFLKIKAGLDDLACPNTAPELIGQELMGPVPTINISSAATEVSAMRFNASSSPEVRKNPLQFAPGVAVRATMETEMSQLSTRAHNALKNHFGHEDFTPEVVSKLSRMELSRIPNCGRVSVDEINAWLVSHGLCLKPIRHEFGAIDPYSDREVLEVLSQAEAAIQAAIVTVYRRAFVKQFEKKLEETRKS